MGRWTMVLAGLVLVGLLVHLWASWSFRRSIGDLEKQLAQAPAPGAIRADLPDGVRDFALRGMAGAAPEGRVVRLRQASEMVLKPDGPWLPITARQTIGLTSTGFVWEAAQKRGPITVFRVLDAFVAGTGQLRARLLGSIPVAGVEGGSLDRGEAMRYLAELPWAPDAILLNREIAWRVLESGEIEARLAMEPRDAVVRFELNDAGDFAVIRADDRPATDAAGNEVLREWRGRFDDYGDIGGRRIPRRGEVGYIIEDQYAPYWRGEVIAYGVE